MNFEELSDDEWMQICSLVSDEPPIRLNRRGRPRAEPRVVANAVLWILTTGESWSRLPARYPSGPTCRRRFEEWHVSGTLLELVELLSQRGRKFVYVPQPAQADTQPVAVAVEEVSAEDDGQPAVYWKSPEAWQAPAALADAPLADPMESMMQQLAGGEAAVPASFASPATAERSAQPGAPLAPARVSKPVATRAMPREERGTTHRGAHAAGLAVQVAEWRGYTMSLTVQPVRNRMFRGAVEILKDGRRLERSGLIGPPFQDRESARNFAFDWAREWVEREGAAESTSGASFPVSHPARHSAAKGVAQSVPQAALGAAVPPAQSSASATRGGDASSAVITRSLPPAVPGSVRLAPLQRYTATGTLLTGSDARDASNAASGSAERRPAGTRYRTLAR
ncbi:transposase [Paraburkholderia lycopersici]|uniref:Putative transposase of IS4/5 family n=1 Tax=Paraburkholderia lycopersici TaxID=416944 RepID=A0A1G6V5M6_9BURK|nr:transposase [Paraburkholderia lycopersici]SDD48990.1 Putative transposase of IS4/5 family [Paraburkholderia lycopersici]